MTVAAPREIEIAYKYCESVTKNHAKSFYFAARFLPREKRRAIFPIYAFCRHVDDEIDEIGEGNSDEAVKTVEKWQANLSRVYQNHISEETVNKHQKLVFTAWRDLLGKYKIPQNLPSELIKGVLMDTQKKRYENFEELYLYCYRVASTVGLMASEVFGYTGGKQTLDYAEALGVAMQLTNILRDTGEDADIGRIYLPQEDLQKFNVSEAQIFDKKVNENFVELMKFQIARARKFYQQSEKGIPFLEPDSRLPVLFAHRLYSKILDEIERNNYDVFFRRAHTTKTEKLFSIPSIWREARNI